jgi:DNA-binding Xre family transcriptional regulator
MNSELTGKVDLRDFQELRIAVKGDFKKEIFENAKTKAGSWGKLSKIIGMSRSSFQEFHNGKRAIPFTILKNVCKFVDNHNFEENINGFKIGNAQKFVKNKNSSLQIDFETEDGAKIVGAFLGDGSRIGSSFRYTNKETCLIDLVNKSVQDLIGEVGIFKYTRRPSKRLVHCVVFPSTVSSILDKIGIPIGDKIVTNPSIPKFLLNSDKREVIATLIRQFADDEATSRHQIEFYQSSDVTILPEELRTKILSGKYKEVKDYEKYAPNVLKDIKFLLWKHWRIRCGGPYPTGKYRIYSDKKGNLKYVPKWKLTISGKEDLEKFEAEIGFNIKEKQEALKERIKEIRTYQSKKSRTLLKLLMTAKNLEESNLSITSSNLSKFLDRDFRTINEYLLRLLRKGYITRPMKRKYLGIGIGTKPFEYTLTGFSKKLIKKYKRNPDMRFTLPKSF